MDEPWKKNCDRFSKYSYNPEKSDIFSLGLIFLSMLLRDFNIRNINEYQNSSLLHYSIEKIKFGWAINLLRMMLSFEPENRSGFSWLLNLLPDSRPPTHQGLQWIQSRQEYDKNLSYVLKHDLGHIRFSLNAKLVSSYWISRWIKPTIHTFE